MKLTTAATAALITLGPLPKVTTPPTDPAESAPAPAAAKTAGESTPAAAKTAGESTPVVKKPQVKKPAPKASNNPVHDTIKTVRGMLDNTRKTWTPKPKKATAPKADTAAK